MITNGIKQKLMCLRPICYNIIVLHYGAVHKVRHAIFEQF